MKTWMEILVKTWMRIFHGKLKRLKIRKVIKGTSLPPPHTVNVIELNCKVITEVATPHFYINPPPFSVWKYVLRTMRQEYGFRNASNWSWRQIFWRCFDFLVKFSYWSKFYVNIISGSAVVTVFFYKGLTRNAEIANTPVGILPNILRLERISGTTFGTDVSNEMLLNAAKYQRYSYESCKQ